MVKISVIIPTYNRQVLLHNCLSALIAQNYSKDKFEILVCDDGSSDKTKEVINNLQIKHANLRLLTQLHGGVFTARNMGIKNSQGEIVVFTDDDCLPQKNWLTQIEKTFDENPKVLGVEGKTITYPHQVTPLTSQIVNTKGNGYQTCNIAYQRKILRKIGGLDKHLKYPHCEDVDLALRVLKYGQIIFKPKALVIHPPRPDSFLHALNRIRFTYSELYLFLKHPDYFYQKYGKRNIFWQVVFQNAIWIRLFHLKFYSNWIRKNPSIYLKFIVRTVLEIILIVLSIPQFYLSYKKLGQLFSSSQAK